MVQKRQLFRYAVDTFVSLLENITKRKNVNYKCNNSDISAWNNFLTVFGENIGENFINDFIEFGFQSWFNSRSEKNYSHDIRFSWLFGKPAIKRWKKNSPSTNKFFVRSELKKSHKINLTKKTSEATKLLLTIRPIEEQFKSEYYNTQRGFLWCIANTTLYFHKSSWCVNCNMKKNCKDILKNEYSKVYKLRGYE